MKHLFSSTALLLLFLTNTASAQDVTIGKQKWTSKNLNVSSFRNGSKIPQVQDADDWIVMGLFREPAWCYYQSATGLDSSSGKLYNWYAVNDVRGLAPQGWHVATKEEWESLSKGKNAAAKMKSTTGWKTAGTNANGFSALAGGNRNSTNARFFDLGSSAFWWTANDLGLGKAASISLVDGSEDLTLEANDNKTAGLSVRCVAGEPAVPLKNKLKNFKDSIIGIPSKIANLEVADVDFPGMWNLAVATRACAKLGDGWRLPTQEELDIIWKSKRELGGFKDEFYWYNDAAVKDSYGFLNFKDGETGYVDEKGTGHVRAVRTVQ